MTITNALRTSFGMLLLSILFIPGVVLAGFGVSPPEISEDSLVPGSQLERTIYLVQGDPEEPLDMVVSVESETMADWISFEQGNEFTIPQDVQQYPLTVRIAVPEDTPLGVYKGFIRVNTKPAESAGQESGTVTIAIGGRVDVSVTVGDGVVSEYNVRSIKILDITEGDDPQVTLRVQNTGNVPSGPASASFELFNKFGNVRLAYAENSDFEKTPSFSESETTLAFPVDVRFAPGEYWAYVQVYDEQGGVIKELKTVFNVKEKTLMQKLLWPAVAAGALVVFGGSGFALYAGLNRRRRPRA